MARAILVLKTKMAKKISSNSTSQVAGDYIQTLNPQGYVNNREITNLPGQYLTVGSFNCFIRNYEKAESRFGSKLLGQKKTVNKGVHSSFDWNDISSGKRRSLKAFSTSLKAFYQGNWETVFTLPTTHELGFTTWWSTTELIDFMLFCNGSDSVFQWSGAMERVAGVTANTITKQGYLSSNLIAFFDNGAGVPDTITKIDGGFVNGGFKIGDTIQISGSVHNDGTYTITGVIDTALTVGVEDILTNESSGASIVLQWPNGSWEASRAITIDGGVANNRSFTINGAPYVYTGGEGTGTLTGVSPSPFGNVNVGDLAIQTVREFKPSALNDFIIDIIFTTDNQVVYGSGLNRTVYGSKNTDFTDFTFTSPLRLPGEGFTLQFDACPTAFISGPDNGSIARSLYTSCGVDSWYRTTFQQQTSADGLGNSRVYEITPTLKLPSGIGSAALSQDACVDTKDGTAILNFDKSIDNLANVSIASGPKSLPISDPIRLDMLGYDLTGAHGIYFRRMLFYTLPKEGRIIVYDTQNDNYYWQPPQLLAISRLAIIDIDGELTLCGHSTNSDETYTLFDPSTMTDNGAKYKVQMYFGYENYGMRFTKKNLDELASEMYTTKATVVGSGINYDYKGATAVRTFQTFGNDSGITFTPSGDGSEGSNPEGYTPLGSTTDEIPDIVKLKVIHDTTRIDFYEAQRFFWSNSENPYFSLIARGENVAQSENLPNELHK